MYKGASMGLTKLLEKAKKEWERFLKRLQEMEQEETNPPATNPPEDNGGTIQAPSAFHDVSKPFVGYMTVNNWSAKDPLTVLRQLAAKGIQAAPFEFFEWSSPDKFNQTDKLIAAFQGWIDASQETKTILYATLYNANLGTGKYGDAGITADKYDSQIRKVAAKFAEWTKKYSNVYLPPGGEGGTAKSKSYDKTIQTLCKKTIPLNRLVNNFGARPTDTDGMGYFCQHPASTSATVAKGAWAMSDHSSIIIQGALTIQLNGGTGLYGKCHYQTAFAYALKCLKAGNPFFYYHFDKNGSIDEIALKALGDAVKAFQGESPAPNVPPTSETLAPSSVKWLSASGPDYKNAKTVFAITSAEMVGSHLNFKTDKPIPWKERGEKNVNAIGILIRKTAAGYVGGKCEWCVGSRGWFDVRTNTVDGYNGHTTPAKGEKCFAGLGSPDDGKEISTLVEFAWTSGNVKTLFASLFKARSEFADFEAQTQKTPPV